MSFARVSTVWGDPELDVEATVTARAVRCDYGVPGSPVWTEYEDQEIMWPIELDGVPYARHEVRMNFGDEALHELSKQILAAAADIETWEEYDD